MPRTVRDGSGQAVFVLYEDIKEEGKTLSYKKFKFILFANNKRILCDLIHTLNYCWYYCYIVAISE